MVEKELAEVDDAAFPLASARLIEGTFRLSGTVELPGSGQYRGHVVRLPIQLSVTNVLSYEVVDTSGTDTLVLESARPFDGGLHLIGVIPCVVTLFTTEHSRLRLDESETPVAFRRWWRWHPIANSSPSNSNNEPTPEGLITAQPVMPLFIANNEDDDLAVAPSIAWALEGMEPPEVSDGHYLLFDATGRRGHVRINRFDIELERWDEGSDVAGLRSRIDGCLALHSLLVDESLDGWAYVDEAARLIFDESRKNQWPKWPGWLRKKIHGDQMLPIFLRATET